MAGVLTLNWLLNVLGVQIYSVEWAADDRQLISASADGSAKLWEVIHTRGNALRCAAKERTSATTATTVK